MIKQPITLESFTAALEAVVEDRGHDWTYPESVESDDEGLVDPSPWFLDGFSGCRYFLKDSGECACIIGATLDRLGYTAKDIERIDGETESADTVLSRLGAEDPTLLGAATVAQSRQDSGARWGHALRAFHDTIAAGWEY